jgi:glycerophosphoryl diester phosphodiesterase
MKARIAILWCLFSVAAPAVECVAHRGDSANHPDNSLAAIRSAWKVGAELVELDVRMTADGVLVLFHDARIDRVPVGEIGLSDLKQKVGSLATLRQVLQATMAGGTLLLDLKEGSEEFLESLIREIEPFRAAGGRVILQSTHLGGLDFLRRRLPAIELLHVTDLGSRSGSTDSEEWIGILEKHRLQGITAKGRRFVDRAYVASFRKRGLKYYVWTINQPDRMKHYAGLGVDGIITDDPALFRRLFGEGK